MARVAHNTATETVTDNNDKAAAAETADVSAKPAPLYDSLTSAIVLAISGGADTHGHYVTATIPDYDPSNPAHVAAFAWGVRYDLTRRLQSAVKKAKGDVAKETSNIAEFLASYKPDFGDERVRTIASLREEFTRKEVETKLSNAVAAGKIAANIAAAEQTVQTYIAQFLARDEFRADIDLKVQAYLAAGYTPTARGKGETKTDVKLDALPDLDSL